VITQPSSLFETERSGHAPALNPHRPTPLPAQTPSRFPPSRLFGRLPPCIPSRLRLAGVRKPLTIPAVRRTAIEPQGSGRVEMWRGGGRLSISVSAPFVWRCLNGSAMAPFPHPAHRTGLADFPHPPLGEDFTLSRATPSAASEHLLE